MELHQTPNSARAHWFPWAVVALTALAAALRFSTLGLQSYTHDEAVTAGRVLTASLPGTMHRVWTSESTPPLYYLLAWAWSRLFGVHEVGLRSLSALFGTMTVPLAALVGRELVGRRAGVALAAIAAFSPLLVWYSQDARAYALLVLLTTAALLFFVRAKRSESSRDLGAWAVCGALALATHYFAVFPLAIEAAWLLLSVRRTRRAALAAAAVGLAGIALAPIALHQAQGGNNDWIAAIRIGRRLHEAGIALFAGETGLLKHAVLPAALCLAATGLLLWRGSESEKRGAAVALGVGGGSVLLALAIAALGQDYVLARNLLPALIPLAMVPAAGIAARSAGLLGSALGAVLVVYLLAFNVYADVRVPLQREDWRSVAERIGPPMGRPRAIVAYEQGGEPLSYYLAGRQRETKWKVWRHHPVPLAEVDVVSGRPPPPRSRALPPSFRRVEAVTIGRMTLTRYAARRASILSWPSLERSFTGYRENAVLLDGPGTSPAGAR